MSDAAIIVWWNQTAIAAGGESPASVRLAADEEGLLALCDFIAELPERPKAVRLFCHSSSVEHLSTACPRGTRKVIGTALSHRIPALQEEGVMWAAHDVRPGPDGTATLIYVEPNDRLRRLQQMLAERGIHLEAAFPLLCLVEECALAADRAQPRIAVVAAGAESAVFWVTPAGERHATFFDGATASERTKRELVDGFAIFKKQPRFTVISANPDDSKLADTIAAEAPHEPDRIAPLSELVASARSLSPKILGNYLPPGPPFTLNHLCYAAAVGFIFAGVLCLSSYRNTVRALHAAQQAQQEDLSHVQFRINRLRENKTHIDDMNAVLREAILAPPTKLLFLEALNRARPPQITIRSLNLGENSWVVTAVIHDGANLDKGPAPSFVASLRKDGSWTISTDHVLPTLNGQEFTISGTFP